MAVEAGNRDIIFANFQAASGIEDYNQCISILESHNWDLQIALSEVFIQEELENQRLSSASANRYSPVVVDDVEQIIIDPDPVPSIVQRDGAAPCTTSVKITQLFFNIIWHEKTLPVLINDDETVGALKRILEIQTGLSQSEIGLEGWPIVDFIVRDSTVLSSLNLCSETHLVLHSPSKVTVSPAVYLPCNIPECRTRKESFTDENDDSPPPRAIDVMLRETQSSNSPGFISLNVNYDGRDYRLKYNENQTIKDVKQELYMLTKIPTRQQELHGWPEGVTDSSRLSSLRLSQPNHFLLLSSSQTSMATSTHASNHQSVAVDTKNWDSRAISVTDDTDFDEQFISEDEDSIFNAESTHSRQKIPLLPRNSLDTSDSLINLQHQFEERYGEFHPAFYIGSLKDAIDEAAGNAAVERRPLLIYLHHDKSIFANIFCSQILCSEQFVSFVSQNFLTWPWDMTDESNRQRFVGLLVQHFGNMAANTVSKFPDGQYPLLLIVTKSKSGLEVCSVLQGNSSLEQLMMNLINGYEVFEQAKLVEVRSERERNEREAMKLEQDAAYMESLAADRAKAEIEKARAQQEVEKIHQEQLNAQLKEAERISCEEQLPAEPETDAKNITNILFRFPDGKREARRFKETEKLKIVFMYVNSKGFNTAEHRVVTNFPRTEMTQTDREKTLKDLKLCPQGTLFVEEI